ncbi:MAG: ABC-2 family transporter protein [bacterium]
MNFIIKLIEIAKVSMKSNISYVFAAWGAFFSNILQIFIFYYIWMAVYGDNTVLNGISKDQMITYIILSRILYTQITWGFIHVIGNKIQSGDIVMDLLRPVDFQLFTYISRLGDIISFGIMNAIPALILAGMFLGLYLPHNPIILLYFIISLLMAITISFFIEFWIGLLAFYTVNSWGLQTLYEASISFFSGSLIPLAFFPHWLKAIVNFLPFKDMLYTPISIYLGIVNGNQILESLFFQFLWVIALLVLSRLIYCFSIKQVTIQGG